MAVIKIDQLKLLAKDYNLLGDNYCKDNFEPSSYDLRVGTIFKDDKILSHDHPVKKLQFVKVKPSEIVTILTLESVKVPQNLCATVFALNSHSSAGFLILNPGHIDPGYEGPISICAINLSSKPFILSLNQKIFTIVFQELSGSVEKNDHYVNKVYSSRKSRELELYDKKFRNLSNSFFDLVIGYSDAKNLLVDRIYDNFKKLLKSIMAIIGIVATLLGLLYLLFPSLGLFNLGNTDKKTKEKEKTENHQKFKKEMGEEKIFIINEKDSSIR